MNSTLDVIPLSFPDKFIHNAISGGFFWKHRRYAQWRSSCVWTGRCRAGNCLNRRWLRHIQCNCSPKRGPIQLQWRKDAYGSYEFCKLQLAMAYRWPTVNKLGLLETRWTGSCRRLYASTCIARHSSVIWWLLVRHSL